MCAVSAISCKKDKEPETPPVIVELDNQINYCDRDTIDIRSAIYETSEGGYVFYLSPHADMKTVEEITGGDDCLRVDVPSANGSIDWQSAQFAIAFRDITASAASRSDIRALELDVKLDGKLTMAVDLEMTSGKILEVKYGGDCPEAQLPVLDNEYELDGQARTIAASATLVKVPQQCTVYSFYEQESSQSAALEIKVKDGFGTSSVDLSSVSGEDITIICGSFDSSKGAQGTLSLERSGNAITLAIDATCEGSRLRADFSGESPVDYESTDTFTVSINGNKEESPLQKVFAYDQSGNIRFAMGSAESPASPADLTSGNYAVAFRFGAMSIGNTIDIATEASKCTFELYDYATYTTWDINKASGQGATGHITVKEYEGNYYIDYSVQFAQGPLAQGQWYGKPEALSEDFDIVPVEPFVSRISITSPSDEVLVDWPVTSVELRHDTDFRDSYTGDIIPGGYIFYFRNEHSTDIEDKTTTPQFILPDDYVGCEGVDLHAEGDKIKWSLSFTNSNLSQYNGYGYNSSWAKRCPNEATLTATREGKEWTFMLMLKDYGQFGYSESGTNNILKIEWKGTAVKYTGSKPNDMTDSDY